jgi:hypothetical protein
MSLGVGRGVLYVSTALNNKHDQVVNFIYQKKSCTSSISNNKISFFSLQKQRLQVMIKYGYIASYMELINIFGTSDIISTQYWTRPS